MLHVGFVIEQVLGHVTHGANLQRYVAHDGLTGHWVLPGYETDGIAGLVPVYRSNWTLRSGLRARRALVEIQRRQQLDALFFHTQTTSLLSADMIRHRPTVISVDATPSQYDSFGRVYDQSGFAFEALKAAGMRRVLSWADHVIAWSSWAEQSLVEDYGVAPERVSVVPPGVPVDDFDGGGPTPPHEGPVRVLFVGGDLARKGGHHLIEACRRLGDLVELHVVTRDRHVRSGPGRVVHRGLTPNSPGLLRLFHDSDLFALPTLGDCLPMVLSEAGAASLPAVSTPVAAIPEIVLDGVTGRIVPVADVDALADAIGALAEDPDERARLGSAARSHVRDRYDVQQNADRVVQILTAVAHGREVPKHA